MQDFPERTALDAIRSWSALYKGHDWARTSSFYFVITVYEGDQVAGQFPVELFDYAYGDASCLYSEHEVWSRIKQDLHELAQGGESNTVAMV